MELRTKISILVIVLIIITVGVVSYLSSRYEVRTKISEVEDRMVKMATIIGTLGVTKEKPTWECYQEYIDKICRLNFSSRDYSINILYIALLDENNKPRVYGINFDLIRFKGANGRLIQKASVELVEILIKKVENREITTGGDIQTVSFNVEAGDKTPALLKIGYSRKLLKKGIREIWIRNFQVLICLIIIGIILSFILARRLTKPIEKLSVAMMKVSEGDISQNVEVTSNDEVGSLIKGFNFMTERLRERDRIKDTFQ